MSIVFATPVFGSIVKSFLRDALHGDQRLAVRRRDDAVQVELPGHVLVLAAERDRRHPAAVVPGPGRDLVEHRPLRVGEVDAMLRGDSVVDERRGRARGELELPYEHSGLRVVDEGVPEAGARDPEQAVVVLDAGRRARRPGRPGRSRRPRPCEGRRPRGAAADRADIGGVPVPDLDPLRREAVRQGDRLRKSRPAPARPSAASASSSECQQEIRRICSPSCRYFFLTATQRDRIPG